MVQAVGASKTSIRQKDVIALPCKEVEALVGTRMTQMQFAGESRRLEWAYPLHPAQQRVEGGDTADTSRRNDHPHSAPLPAGIPYWRWRDDRGSGVQLYYNRTSATEGTLKIRAHTQPKSAKRPLERTLRKPRSRNECGGRERTHLGIISTSHPQWDSNEEKLHAHGLFYDPAQYDGVAPQSDGVQSSTTANELVDEYAGVDTPELEDVPVSATPDALWLTDMTRKRSTRKKRTNPTTTQGPHSELTDQEDSPDDDADGDYVETQSQAHKRCQNNRSKAVPARKSKRKRKKGASTSKTTSGSSSFSPAFSHSHSSSSVKERLRRSPLPSFKTSSHHQGQRSVSQQPRRSLRSASTAAEGKGKAIAPAPSRGSHEEDVYDGAQDDDDCNDSTYGSTFSFSSKRRSSRAQPAQQPNRPASTASPPAQFSSDLTEFIRTPNGRHHCTLYVHSVRTNSTENGIKRHLSDTHTNKE
ncbi:hypothetical protein R3P38DRAFT_3518522 [Favolaschia claudopus]|uniref:Uncharacterized protein n=1 Tax=Favolaschia claudopus TaxID=2862362 RepID=A0AAW0BPC5_9AGAR